MLIMRSGHMFDLDMREKSDKLLNNSSIRHKSNLLWRKLSTNLLNDDHGISLHPKSIEFPSVMIRTSYLASLLEQWKSSLKDNKCWCLQDRTKQFLPYHLVKWRNHQPQGTILRSLQIKCPPRVSLYAKASTLWRKTKLINMTRLVFKALWK